MSVCTADKTHFWLDRKNGVFPWAVTQQQLQFSFTLCPTAGCSTLLICIYKSKTVLLYFGK